jgi:hypothetical protein
VESSSVKEQNGITVDPFIVDMTLWQILKGGKPSYDAGRDKFVLEKTGSKNFPEKVQCGIAGDVNVHPSLFCNVAAQGLENQTSFYVNTSLLSSGLSPPLA